MSHSSLLDPSETSYLQPRCSLRFPRDSEPFLVGLFSLRCHALFARSLAARVRAYMYFAKRGPSTRCVPLARRSIEGEASVFRTFLQFELDSGEFNPRRRKRPVRDPLRLASCKLLLRLDLTLVCVCAVGGGGGGGGGRRGEGEPPCVYRLSRRERQDPPDPDISRSRSRYLA